LPSILFFVSIGITHVEALNENFGVTQWQNITAFRSEFAYYYPFAELMTKTFIFDFLDDTRTFIDVGANIGTHSIVAARNARRVISIEGDVHNNSLLKVNTQ
jgi:predicted RNA methylase